MSGPTLDPRIRRTRAAMEAALRDLIAERDMAQISVSDITKRAGVNRSTFYEHYADVHELAAASCTTLFDELVSATPAPGHWGQANSGPENPLPRLFAHVVAHAPLYRALLCADGSARVVNHLLRRMSIAIHVTRRPDRAVPPTHADDPDDIPHDPTAAFLAGAVLGSVIDWLTRGCPGTPDRMAATLLPLILACHVADPASPERD